MPKLSKALLTMPPAASSALEQMGRNLALARNRRGESLKTWSGRMGVSIPTLLRLEAGDPGVAIGIVATAFWLLGRDDALPEVVSPANDRGALEADVRRALNTGRRRSRNPNKNSGEHS